MLNTISDKVLAKAIRTANWQAIKNPGMEYRVAMMDGEVFITEWLLNSCDFNSRHTYLFCTSYPDGCGTPSHEQHAFIERIPEVIKEIRKMYSKEDSFQ